MSETLQSYESHRQPTLEGLEHPRILSLEEMLVYYDAPERTAELGEKHATQQLGFAAIETIAHHGHPTLGHDRFWVQPQ